LVAVLVAVDADFKVIVAVQTTFVAKLDMVLVMGTDVLATNGNGVLDTVTPSESLLTTISVVTPAVGIFEVTVIFTSCVAPNAA
jgi:hypothetical protein